MNAVLQQFIVIAVVIAAALFAAWRLVTVRIRLSWVEVVARHVPPATAVGRWLQRLAERQRAALGAGCAACGAAGERRK